MSEDFWKGVTVVITVALIILIGMWIIVWHPHSLNNTCHEKFGSQWQGRTSSYSPDVCVNSKGEVKYP